MNHTPLLPRLALGLLLAVGLPAGVIAEPEDRMDAEEPPTQVNADTLPGLIEDFYSDDDADSLPARAALLLARLDDEAMIRLLRAAQTPEQLNTARGVVQHQVLTRLREEELADLEDDTVLIGFQFRVMATAGMLGPDAPELAERYPHGAQVTSTTAGFPGGAYLLQGDLILAIDGQPIPELGAGGQQYVIDTVRGHTLDQPVEMLIARGGEAVALTVPLARAEALARMYAVRGTRYELIDPFRFLWEEAWSTLLLDAGHDEPPPADPAQPGNARP